MFFSFDGVDGAGKSTQLKRFCDWLTAQGHDVVTCRDPGTTPIGESLRTLVLAADAGPVARRTEMLMYMAARAQLIDEVIAPALAAGRTVVSDRFVTSNIVYQGHAGGLDVEAVREIGRFVTGGLEPDLSFILDMPPERALARVQRAHDRMEAQGDDFRAAVRQGFLREAQRAPERFAIIDASRSIDEVHDDVVAAAERVLKTAGAARSKESR